MNNEEFYEVNELMAASATQNVSPRIGDSYMNADGENDEFYNASADRKEGETRDIEEESKDKKEEMKGLKVVQKQE